MIGVTIGCGGFYKKAAILAAECLKYNTGLESIILDETHLKKSDYEHPAALKLSIFDHVQDETVLYYDADWFCIREWSPQQFIDHPNLIACQDYVLQTDWPDQKYDIKTISFSGSPNCSFIEPNDTNERKDYIESIRKFNNVSLHYRLWFNTGMFIVSRNRHTVWLREAERIYRGPTGHHSKYFEQPALVLASEKVNLRVDYLPRKFNVLVSSGQDWPINMIGAHVKSTKSSVAPLLIKAIQSNQASPENILELLRYDEGQF